jgi:hypothetical protein
MADLSVTGGARVGLMNASWPLARLTADGDRLTVSVFLLGTYTFTARDIVSVEARGSTPLFKRGIRLRHNRPDYPERIEFWTLGSPTRLLDRIRAAGFGAAGLERAIVRGGRGFPLRRRAVIILLLAWNVPFLIDHLAAGALHVPPGLISLIPLGGAFALSWATLHSPGVQSFLLKDGRSVKEIRQALLLLRFVLGVIFFGTLAFLITSAFF